jgi:hypothetical protein
MAREVGILIDIIHGGMGHDTKPNTITRKIPQERGFANSESPKRSETFAERSSY